MCASTRMRVLLIAVLLVICGLQGSLNSRESQAVVRVQGSDVSGVKMTVTLPPIEVKNVLYDGTSYDLVTLPEGLSLANEGDPDLPVIRKFIGVPECQDVVLTFHVMKESKRQGINVAPKRREYEQGKYAPVMRNAATYGATSAYYPEAIVRLDRISKMRDQRIAAIDIVPVQYLPGTGEVRIIEEIEVNVEFINATGSVIANVGPMQNLMRGTLSNYDGTPGAPAVSPDGRLSKASAAGVVCRPTGNNWMEVAESVRNCGTDYLILVADEIDDFPDDLPEQLASRRSSYNGFNVAIVKISQLLATPLDDENTPLQIRDFIQYVYDGPTYGKPAAHMADGHLGYVLLLGDTYNETGATLLPSYYGCYGEPGWEEFVGASDAYYSFLNGGPDDYFADVFLGRIPANAKGGTNVQLQNAVTKITTYSGSNFNPRKLLMVFGNMDAAGEPFEPEILSLMPPYIRQPVDRLSRFEPPYSGYDDAYFSNEVKNFINSNGYWAVSCFGHGTPMYLQYSFLRQDHCNLSNPLPALFLLFGCQMGRFDCTSVPHGCGPYGCQNPGSSTIDLCDAMAEALAVQEHGAVGVLAFARDAQTWENSFVHVGFYRALSKENAFSLGELLLFTRLYAPNRSALKGLTLFGDPALNAMGEQGTTANVDLAVRESNIQISNAFAGEYLDVGDVYALDVAVENLGSDPATGVMVNLWDGPPDDPGSSIIDTRTIPALAGFGAKQTVTFTYSASAAGTFRAFMQVLPNPSGELIEENNVASKTFYAYDYVEGYPIQTGVDENSVHRGVTVADVAPAVPGKEVLVCASISGGPLSLCCFTAAGVLLWQVPATFQGQWMEPLVADMHKNGEPYCIILSVDGEPASSKICLIKGSNGAIEQTIDIEGGMTTLLQGQMALITDLITDDAALEIVVARHAAAEMTTYVDAYSIYQDPVSQSYHRWSVAIGTGIDSHACGLAVADVDNDGIKEIVAVSEAPGVCLNSVCAIKAPNSLSGSPVMLWPPQLIPSGMDRRSVKLVPNLPQSASVEILVNGGQQLGQISRLNSDGTVDYSNGYVFSSSPLFSVADVDNDSELEIVAVAGNTLGVLSATTGQLKNQASCQIDGTFKSTPLLVDVNGDGELEFIAAYENGGPRLSGGQRGTVQVFNKNAQPIAEAIDFLAGSVSPPLFWAEQNLALADIDGNGRYEVIFMSLDGILSAISVGSASGRAGWTQRYKYPTQTNLVEQPLMGPYLNDLSLAGDVRVVNNVQLECDHTYIDAGTTLRFENSCGLNVYNELVAKGSATERIVFTPAGDNPQAGCWGGIWLNSNAQASLDYCDVDYALYGFMSYGLLNLSHVNISHSHWGIYTYNWIGVLDAQIANCSQAGILFLPQQTYDPVTLEGLQFQNVPIGIQNNNYDLKLDVTMSGSYGTGIVVNAKTTVENSSITNGSGLGIHIKPGKQGIVRNTTIETQSGGGVFCDGCTATSELDTVTANDNATFGIKLANVGAMKVEDCTASSNDVVGLLCDAASPEIMACEMKYNATGGEFKNGSNPNVSYCIASNNNVVGLLCAAASPEIMACVMQYNPTGAEFKNGSNPTVSYCTISNSTNGVKVNGNSFPKMGQGTIGGYNTIMSNSSKHVVNTNANQSTPVYAQYDFWGKSTGPSPSKFTGNVVYVPFLSEPEDPPDPHEEGQQSAPMPIAYRIATVYPNPFNPTTTIQYDVPFPGGDVSIAIYNVAGQRVAELVRGFKAGGAHSVSWHGRDVNERSVSSGIYFVRLTAGKFVETKKLVLLK